MSHQTRFITIWTIAWLCLLVLEADSIKTRNCLQLIQRNFWNDSEYDQVSQQLFLQFNNSFSPKLRKCLDLTKPGTAYKLQLVSVGEEQTGSCCDLECPSSNIFIEEDVTDMVRSNASHVTFQYVTGRYFMRLVRVVSEGGGTCEEGSFSSCSSLCGPMVQYSDTVPDECQPGTTNTSDTNNNDNFEVVINQSYQEADQLCNFEFDISFPVCHVIHTYSSVNVSSVEVPLNFTCSELDILDWDNFEVVNVSIMII